jgi:methenyltetrahydrofolate cyclohydrolase
MSSSGRLIADETLGELLASLAAPTPAPGGGTAGAVAAASAASLVEMAASFTLAREDHAAVHGRMGEVVQRGRELRARLVALAEQELHAYEPVLEAIRLSREDPARGERVARALSDAAESPLGITRAAAAVAQLGAELAAQGAPRLVGDAVTATLLAEAACAAAGRLLAINLAAVPEDPRLAEASDLAGAAAAARVRALDVKQS